jgi:methanogenic corrinoid protein MtbC1
MEKIKEGSFADGIRALNTRGALVIPTRLTKARARVLLDFVDEFKHHWYATHDKDNTEGEDDMQQAMQWVMNQISKRWSQNELFRDETVRGKKKLKN